ncbi:MAG: thermonuclease family protein [Myxococcales bacterium]|nr:thermonuclease family protein [Myxococcales bacterium]
MSQLLSLRMTTLMTLTTFVVVSQSFSASAALPSTKVYLNGVPAPVYFNDGDSFRVLGGALKGTKARLAGFNTLESYGNTHSWGGWHAKELYHNAKQGTLNGRNGVWHCTSDMKRDGYGRILWWCPDLALSQVSKGLAHVMSVKGPGIPMLVKAQTEAIKKRVGMWSHGVPKYVVTSLHSADEPWFKGLPYNRMVSTATGASRKWRHRTHYQECDKVCWHDVTLTPAALAAAIVSLKTEAKLKLYVGRYTDKQLGEIATAYRLNADLGLLQSNREIKERDARYTWLRAQAEAFDEVLSRMEKAGKLVIATKVRGACMVHAGFKRRYGAGSASCLH